MEARVLRSRDMKLSTVVLPIHVMPCMSLHLPDTLASVQEHSEYALTFEPRGQSSFSFPLSQNSEGEASQLFFLKLFQDNSWLAFGLFCLFMMLEKVNKLSKANHTFLFNQINVPFLWAAMYFHWPLRFGSLAFCHKMPYVMVMYSLC